MFTYARVRNTPLIAVVAPSLDDVLAEWRRRSLIAGGLTLALGAVFVVLSWLLAFTLQDKVAAQAELIRLAATDPLTGLSNRRVLDRRLDEEWLRARRHGSPMSVLFVDIDHFKQFNDTFGHEAGDAILREVAEIFMQTVRAEDIACRYGGEEFVIILPETPLDVALERAEFIRGRVREMRIRSHETTLREVTVSIGVAMYPESGGTLEELLRASDRALYAAKHRGRNQLVLADTTVAV